MADFHDAVAALERVTARVVSGQDLDATLTSFAPVLTEVMGARHWSVMLKKGDILRIHASRGIPEDVAKTVTVKLGEGIAGRVALTGMGGLLHDLVHSDRTMESTRAHYATGSAICVPIRLQNDILGVINLNDKQSADGQVEDFDEDDLLLSKIVANQAAMSISAARALEDAREYERMRASRRAMEAEVGALRTQARAFDIIRQVTDVLVVGGDVEEVFATIIGGTTHLLDAGRGSLMLLEADQKSLRITAGNNLPQGLLNKIVGKVGEGIAGGVAASGEARLLQHMPNAESPARDDGQGSTEKSKTYQTSSAISVPLKMHGQVLGVLNINDRRDGLDFTEADLFISQVVATQAAVVISNARLLEETVSQAERMRDLAIARKIQQAFVPPPMHAATFEIAGKAEPAADAGGDYIDVVMLSEDDNKAQTFMVCGDVSGHGVGAALIMATGRAFLHALLGRYETLEEVMGVLNDLLESNTSASQYMTLFLGRISHEGRVLEYCSAGHEPGLLYRAGKGELEYLESSGMPLGMMPGEEYEATSVPIESGDVLLVATDGIHEARNEPGEYFGKPRLEAALKELAHEQSEDIINGIKSRVLAFAGGRSLEDDLSLFVMKATD